MKKEIGLYIDVKPIDGGSYQYVLSIIKALQYLDKSKYHITVFYFDSSWEKLLPSSFKLNKIKKNIFLRVYSKIYRILYSKLFKQYKIGYCFQTIFTINHSNCDTIIFPKQDFISYLTNKKSIITVHDLMHKYEPHFKEYQDGEYQKRESHYKLISEKANAILVDSNIGKLHMLESYKINSEVVHILPFVPPYYLVDSNLVNIKLKYNLPERYIFYPAQFWEHKNHLVLLEAIKILKDEGITINLVLLGSKKNNYENVVNKINELDLKDSIYILGYVSNDEIYSFYKFAVAMTFLSLAGPTNIPPIESMLLGCPLICSNVYGMPEQVGDAALLINPYDKYDIASKIKLIWHDDNLRKELIDKGYHKIEKYTQNDFSNKFKSIIDKVVL